VTLTRPSRIKRARIGAVRLTNWNPSIGRDARPSIDSHQHQAKDDGDVADAIGEKAPAFAEPCDQDAGDGGADHARTVEHGGVQGDGVHEVVFANHVDEEGLAAWDVKGVDYAEQGREDEDVPDLDFVGEGERGQDEGKDHGGGLGGDDDTLAVHTIGGNATDRRHEKNWDLTGEADCAEQCAGAGEAVNEPGLGNGLHPGADQGDQLSAEKELEVAMAEGAPHGLPSQAGRRRWLSRLALRNRDVRFGHAR
jgi:hypothetical protein